MTKHLIDWKPDNLFWGYFDANTPPVLKVASGDEVVMNCLPACLPSDLPPDGSGVLSDHILAMEKHQSNRGAGPHMLTGPVFVEGAEAGDVLQVDILEAKPAQNWAFTAILPLLGALPDEFTDYEHLHISVDRDAMTCTLPWGLTLPLDPFLA